MPATVKTGSAEMRNRPLQRVRSCRSTVLRFTCSGEMLTPTPHGQAPVSRASYPFSLRISIEYALTDSGLRVRTTARNIGTDPCPMEVGLIRT